VIHTSGTTGAPKGILRDTGGYATALNYAMRDVYGVPDHSTWLALSDLGWVVGVSFIALGPLIAGATSVMVEGKPVVPHAGALWDAFRRHDVQTCFVAPTALRAIKKLDPEWEHLGAAVPIKQMFLAGERADADTLRWARAGLRGVAVKDHYWATEFGWPGLCNVEACAPEGSAGAPMAGFDFHLLDDEGVAVPAGTPGNLVLKLPLPPGALVTVFGDNPRFEHGYLSHFPGFLNTGDGAVADEEGRLYITGRTDDIFNTAGHRLTTSNLEEAAATASEDVAELCVVGVPDVDGIKGEVPAVFLVMKTGKQLTPAVHKAVRDAIRAEVGPIATPAHILAVDRLPKTRSGKIVRKVVLQVFNLIVREKREQKALALDLHVKAPATIEDHAVVEELYDSLKQELTFNFEK
jgi:propionyl-CoA synthetase